MKNDKDTVYPVLFTLSDVTVMEIVSCPSKVHIEHNPYIWLH